MQKGLLTRKIIHEILFSLKFKNSNFDDLLNLNIIKHNLSISDRKMVQNVILSSMRYNFYIKKIIKNYTNKKISSNQEILLLSATTQIVYLNFKEYAVVNCSVELAKDKNINSHPGFINAILKNIIKDKKKLSLIEINFNDLPKWFVGQNNDKNEYEKKLFLSTIIEKPHLHIVFKEGKLIKKFNEDYVETSSTSVFMKNFSKIENLSRYQNGEWWIQDFISMLPIKLITDLEKKEVIDLCAAPGGKSFQILSNKNNLKMIEINNKRAEVLKKNLFRLGYTNNIEIMDANTINTQLKYDVVLVDAPCSSVGTIRRNPEILFRFEKPNLSKIQKIQQDLLNVAKKILKKNGLIIYMACSFLNLETVNQIKKFLDNNNNFSVNKFTSTNDTNELIDNNGFINTMPKNFRNINIDGFFAAQLRKND